MFHKQREMRSATCLAVAAAVAGLLATAAPASASSPPSNVLAWGANGAGQLGNGSTATSLAPVHVSGMSGVIAVAGQRSRESGPIAAGAG